MVQGGVRWGLPCWAALKNKFQGLSFRVHKGSWVVASLPLWPSVPIA